MPVMVNDEPEFVTIVPPGFLVMIQLPDGSPLNGTEPVAVSHVGWITVPGMGAGGTTGGGSITASSEARDVHPREFLTLKVKVPSARPLTIMVVAEPGISRKPGLTITV